jgi:uncharacterized protein YndB with AHSA1/START domain
MVRIADELGLDAPIDAVWAAIEDPAAHARWHPFVSAIAGGHELHEIRSCSVQVGKKEGTTKERCVEREEGERIAWAIEEDSTGFGRMVSGWRSGFSLAERGGATIVTAQSTFRPNNVLVRAMLPLIRRRFHQTQQAILRGLQEAVEGGRVAGSRHVTQEGRHRRP